MKRNLLHNVVCLFLLLYWQIAGAQDSFRYEIQLPAVEREGFHKIELTPEIIAALQASKNDIRIFDKEQHQVGYVLKAEIPQFKESSFIEFPVVSKKRGADKQTHIIIENTSGKAVSDLLLFIQNSFSYREVNVSGSNDGKLWYIVKENIYLDQYFDGTKDLVVQSILFPPSAYRYFQVTVIGEDLLPVNILKAGIYAEMYKEGKYVPVPSPVILQKDSTDKNSYVWIRFKNAYKVDKMQLSIRGPKFFRRAVSLYHGNYITTRLPYMFFAGSDTTTIHLNGLMSDSLMLKIYNGDNQPIELIDVKAWQLNQYLLAYLESGKTYTMRFGNNTIPAPEYDLAFFADSMRNTVGILTLPDFEIRKKSTIEKKPASDSKVFMWITIAVVLAVLLFFSLRLTKDINKRKD